jgi:putative tryptophan/tyrosine transport system substrate-binding protein
MQFGQLKRREVIFVLGSAVAWPLAARAQERMHRVGVLMGIANDQEGQRRVAAFRQGLQELGWTEGREIGFEYRWGAGDIDSIRAQAAQLIALRPALILANSTIVAKVLKEETRAIPIVFVQVADPVRDGIVASLARISHSTDWFRGG